MWLVKFVVKRRTRITRIARINSWWNSRLIHDNSWLKTTQPPQSHFCHELPRIVHKSSQPIVMQTIFVWLVKFVVKDRTRITRIARINSWWNSRLIHDNSWLKTTQPPQSHFCHELPRIVHKSSQPIVMQTIFVWLVKFVVKDRTRITL